MTSYGASRTLANTSSGKSFPFVRRCAFMLTNADLLIQIMIWWKTSEGPYLNQFWLIANWTPGKKVRQIWMKMNVSLRKMYLIYHQQNFGHFIPASVLMSRGIFLLDAMLMVSCPMVWIEYINLFNISLAHPFDMSWLRYISILFHYSHGEAERKCLSFVRRYFQIHSRVIVELWFSIHCILFPDGLACRGTALCLLSYWAMCL